MNSYKLVITMILMGVSLEAQDLAYASNPTLSQLAVLDPATNSLIGTIPLAGVPAAIAVTLSGDRALVGLSQFLGQPGIAVVDLANRSLVKVIPLTFNPGPIALSPDAAYAWVIKDDQGNSVVIVNVATGEIEATVQVGLVPFGIAITHEGDRVFVTNQSSNTVSVIDTGSRSVIATIPVGAGPSGIGVNPTGTEIWVTDWDAADVEVIDSFTYAVTRVIRVPYSPTGIAFNPVAPLAYVAHGGSNIGISVLDTSVYSLLTSVPTGAQTWEVAVSRQGSRVFGVNGLADTVSVLDTATNTIVAQVPLASYSFRIATPPRVDYLRFEAEANFNTLAGSARIEQCALCSRGAKVTHLGSNEQGALTMNGVIIPTSGTYAVQIDYVNGSSTRSLNLSVNGGPENSIDFPKSGNWNSAPASVTVNITLSQGTNSLRFSNPQSPGPELDRIIVFLH